MAAGDAGVGSSGAALGDYCDARRRTDGRVGAPRLHTAIHHRAEADHRTEVDGAQVDEACRRRQEGRRHQEAEDRPRPEGSLAERALTDDERERADQSGTTAEEQRERSLERRLAMDEPEASSSGRAGGGGSVRPILDDDLATEDIVAEDPDTLAEEADLDRTREEVGEQSSDPAESAEESAMHIERE
jgi:hypothetical protein